jgi:hypothetical protein
MKKAKYFLDMNIPRVSTNISDGERIVKIGPEIDFLTRHLGLSDFKSPQILATITGGTRFNCKFVREDTTWYLVATTDIKKERALVYDSNTKPWFV